VLWLDAVDRRCVDEVGAMNIAFIYEGKHMRTPALSGAILPGITRDSLLKLAPDLGYSVSEDRIDIREVLRDIETGKITEAFGIGTGAVIAPVGRFGYQDRDYAFDSSEPGPVAQRLFKALTDISTAVPPIPTAGHGSSKSRRNPGRRPHRRLALYRLLCLPGCLPYSAASFASILVPEHVVHSTSIFRFLCRGSPDYSRCCSLRALPR
jgi:hypothetical protein